MSEFLGSIHLNKNNDVLVTASNLTFEKWFGCVAYIPSSLTNDYILGDDQDEETAVKQRRSLKIVTSSRNSSSNDLNVIRYKVGIARGKWVLDNEHFLVTSELGHIELFKVDADHHATKNNNESKPDDEDKNVNEPKKDRSDGSQDIMFNSLMYVREHDSLIDCLETRIDEPIALTGSHDHKIKIWDLKEQMSVMTYKAHEDVVCSLSLNQNDSNTFISCSLDGRALLWDTRKPKPAFSIAHNLTGYPSCSSWSPKTACYLIGLGSETGQIGLYDIRAVRTTSPKPYCLKNAHSRLVRRIEFNPDANLLATAAEDCSTRVYRWFEPSVLNDAGLVDMHTFTHKDYVTDLAWCSSDEYISSSWDGTLRRHHVKQTKTNYAS